MKIQTANGQSRLARLVGPASAVVPLALGVACLAAAMYMGAWLESRGVKISEGHLRVRKRVAESIRRLDDVIHPEHVPERISLDIKLKHLQKLEHAREKALKDQVLVTTDDDFVPARLTAQGKTIAVKLRLKGDNTDHLEGDKWSFRVKVAGDETVMGMKVFSLQHPRTRNFLYEWFYQEALAREDVLHVRYSFVDVSLNGRDLGIFALEESFEKRLVEHGRRREGPIVRFDEGPCWEEKRRQDYPYRFADAFQLFGAAVKTQLNGTGAYATAAVDAFQSSKWHAADAMEAVHRRALTLLELFRAGTLKTSEVFDVPKTATWLAITDLLGAPHALWWANCRFYYNPITSRLEPIGFDANAGISLKLIATQRVGGFAWHPPLVDKDFLPDMFRDEAFLEAYLRRLDDVSRPEYLDALLAALDEPLKRELQILRREFDEYEYSTEIFRRNAGFIRSVLEPTYAVRAYFANADNGVLTVNVQNHQTIPVRVVGAVLDGTHFDPHGPAVTLPGRPVNDNPTLHAATFALPAGVTWTPELLKKLKIEFRLLGARQSEEAAVLAWPFDDKLNAARDLMIRKANAQEAAFLDIDHDARIINARPGDWEVTTDLVLPEGFEFRCGPGTRLHLAAGVAVICRGPLAWTGDADDPVVLDSPQADSQGLVVLQAGKPSTLNHVVVRNLAEPSRDGWSLTGAITFYESPVEFRNCRFLDNRCEDGVNVVRSTFLMRDCQFAHTQGDAFDADFSKGEIWSTRFIELGNDAIDISGSVVSVADVHVTGAGDKGISVGEASVLLADNVTVENSNLGAAAKDRSQLEARNLRLINCRAGVAAYQKKPEFGPSTVNLQEPRMTGVETPYRLEIGSEVIVDGNPVAPNATQVADNPSGAGLVGKTKSATAARPVDAKGSVR